MEWIGLIQRMIRLTFPFSFRIPTNSLSRQLKDSLASFMRIVITRGAEFHTAEIFLVLTNCCKCRFAALETIARVPYFSYTSVLHLYETLGWFRKKEYIQIHFAESWNELHHLLIMESLGGNERFLDRFVAQHIAFFYYWLVVVLYMTSPAVAYDLNKHVEQHAYSTYDEFLTSHADELRLLPAPQVAIDYYQKGGLILLAD